MLRGCCFEHVVTHGGVDHSISCWSDDGLLVDANVHLQPKSATRVVRERERETSTDPFALALLSPGSWFSYRKSGNSVTLKQMSGASRLGIASLFGSLSACNSVKTKKSVQIQSELTKHFLFTAALTRHHSDHVYHVDPLSALAKFKNSIMNAEAQSRSDMLPASDHNRCQVADSSDIHKGVVEPPSQQSHSLLRGLGAGWPRSSQPSNVKTLLHVLM